MTTGTKVFKIFDFSPFSMWKIAKSVHQCGWKFGFCSYGETLLWALTNAGLFIPSTYNNFMIILSLSTWKSVKNQQKMQFLTNFFIDEILKKLIYTHILWFVFLEVSVHNCVRIETKNCLKDLRVNALERQCLGASFELYLSTISLVITSLQWIKMIAYQAFFLKKVRIRAFFVIFFKATAHKWACRAINNCLNDINRTALEKGGLGASFELYGGHTSYLSTSLRLIKVGSK